MAAGDAGLERQMADAEYQTICGWVTKYGWLNAAMAERVRQLLHRQQAVVEAARALRDCALRQHGDCEHTQAVADALDKAQAVQPEGESR